jgi:hypothetical protein
MTALHDKIDEAERPLSTLNIDELQKELVDLERRLTPLLNAIRAMQGKKPVFVPKS